MWRAPLLAATLWASSAAGASMPTAGLSARWVADSLSPGSVAFWADSARGRFNATNAGSETTRPTAVALTRHCHTAVRFNGFQFLTVADDPSGNLDPVAQDFYYYAVARTNRITVQNRLMRKGGSPFYDLYQGIAGSVSGCLAFSGGFGASHKGAATTGQWESLACGLDWTPIGTSANLFFYRNGDSSANSAGGISGYTSNFLLPTLDNTSPLQFGDPGNGFYGDVLEYGIFKAFPDATMRSQLQAYWDDHYHFVCPALSSPAATSTGTCTGARDGAKCAQACDSGFVRVAGSEDHDCVEGQWTSSPIVCERLCPTLPSPSNAGACYKRILALGFDTASLRASGEGEDALDIGPLRSWVIEPAVPANARAGYWAVNGTAGVLRSEASQQCRAAPSLFHESSPRWLDSTPPTAVVVADATLRIERGEAGIAFRVRDADDHYRVMIAVPSAANNASIRLESVANGVARVIDEASDPDFLLTAPDGFSHRLEDLVLADVPLRVRVRVVGVNLRVWVFPGQWSFESEEDPLRAYGYEQPSAAFTPLWPSSESLFRQPGASDLEGVGVLVRDRNETGMRGDLPNPLFHFEDYDHPFGPVGLVSNGVVEVDSFLLHTDCDSGRACVLGRDEQACTHLCAVGYEAVAGNLTRTCDGAASPSPAWNGAEVECRILPPVIDPNQPPLRVREDAREDALVGDPIVVRLNASDATVLYELTGTYFLNPATGLPLFRIGGCSGQVTLLTSGVLDFETTPNITLEVRAVPNGDLNSATTFFVRVEVVDVDEAPVFVETAPMRTVNESAAPNSPIGEPIAAIDPEGRDSESRYRIDTGNGNYLGGGPNGQPLITIDALTGQLRVGPAGGLDFESTPVFNLVVRVFSSLNPSIFATVPVRIEIMDVNEPPRVPSPQPGIEIRDGETFVGSVLPAAFVATDDDGDDLFFSIVQILPIFPSLGSEPSPYPLEINETTGVFTWTISPGPFSDASVQTMVDARQVYLVYELVVNVTDHMTPVPSQGRVRLYVLANPTGFASRPVMTGVLSSDTFSTTLGGRATFSGRNFAGIPDANITARLSNQRPNPFLRQYNSPGCHVIDNTTLECDVPPGVGASLSWTFIFTLGSETFEAFRERALVTSYSAPTLTGIINGNGWSTEGGGGTASLTGSGFGTDAALITVEYGQWNVFQGRFDGVTPGTITAVTDAQITFNIPPGFTSLVYFRVTVDGNQVQSGVVTARYASPVIDSVTATNGLSYRALFSSGGFTTWLVVLNGRNFGPTMWGSETVGIAATMGRFCLNTFTLTNCRKGANPHRQIECRFPAGQGTDLMVTLALSTSAYTMSAACPPSNIPAATFQYQQPTLSSVSGALSMPTEGGSTFRLSGSRFGPSGYSDVLVQYGPSGTEIQATACIVVASQSAIECKSSAMPSFISRATNYVFTLSIGGNVYSNSRPVGTGHYAPPLLVSLTDEGASQATTQGGQAVVIDGRNFGPTILGRISYFLSVVDTGGGPASNSSVNPDLVYSPPPVIGNGSGLIQFDVTADCAMVTQHTQIRCLTKPGGGRNLKWEVVVLGQTSEVPTTNYAPPVVRNITLPSVGGGRVTAADTRGGTRVWLVGENFGPPTSSGAYVPGANAGALMQWVRYGSGDDWRGAVNFTVIDHNTVEVTLGPGLGSVQRVMVSVADQVSAQSEDTFSFALPHVVSIDPVTGPPTPTTPIWVRVYARFLPLGDPTSFVFAIFGNTEDGSQRVDVPTEPVARQALPANTPRDIDAVRFQLPAGAGLDRGVRLGVRRETGGSLGPLDVGTGRGSFNYTNPVYGFYELSRPRLTDGELGEIAAMFYFGTTDTSQFLTVTIKGTQLTDGDGDTTSTIDREIMVLPDVDFSATNTPLSAFRPHTDPLIAPRVMLRRWSDDSIRLFTTMTTFSVFIRIRSRGPGPASSVIEYVQATEAFVVTPTDPFIDALAGQPAEGFSTSGGQALTVTAPAGSFQTGNAFRIMVGTPDATLGIESKRCRLIAQRWDRSPVSMTGVPGWVPSGSMTVLEDDTLFAAFVRDRCREQWGVSTLASDTLCTFYCMVPEGQGALAPVVLFRDQKESSVNYIQYAAPSVTRVAVFDVSSNAVVAATTSPATDAVSVPTWNSFLEINGANFGLCPVVTFGASVRRSLCPASSLRPGESRAHNFLRVQVPEGEGRSADLRYNVFVEDRAARATGFPFEFMAPQALSLGSNGGPTLGGRVIEDPVFRNFTIVDGVLIVRGRNFGVFNEDLHPNEESVSVRLWNPVDGFDGAECDPDYIIRTHTEIRCPLPRYGGLILWVNVTIGTRSTVLPNAFSYDAPTISTIQVVEGAQTMDYTPTDVVLIPTNGSATVVVRGTNFGPFFQARMTSEATPRLVKSSCVFFSFAFSGTSNPVPFCDGYESYTGEGELYDGPVVDGIDRSGSVVSWTHDTIVLTAPSGHGRWRLSLYARGPSTIEAPVMFEYRTPTLTSWTSYDDGTGISTRGGTLVDVFGLDLGPGTANPSRYPTMTYPRALPLPRDALPPLWYTRVVAAGHCLTASFTFDDRNPEVFNIPSKLANIESIPCTAKVVEHNSGRIRVTMPPGVGRNRILRVDVMHHDNSGVVLSSNTLTYTYGRPIPERTDPNILLIRNTKFEEDENMPRESLLVIGRNMGAREDEPRKSLELYRAAGWNGTMRMIVNGNDCQGLVSRVDPNTTRRAAPGEDVYVCPSLPTSKLRVGPARVSIITSDLVGDLVRTDVDSLVIGCEPTFFGRPTETCIPCPTMRNGEEFGATCKGFFENVHHMPAPNRGWFDLNGTMMSACPVLNDPDRADEMARGTCIVPCVPAEACVGNNLCAVGYTSKEPSFRCADCASGFYRRNGLCEKCPNSPWVMIVFFVIVAAGAATLGYVLNQKNVNVAILSIGVDYFQVLALFASSRVKWPSVIQDILYILSAFNLNIEVTAPECSIPELTYERKWWMVMALPLSASGLLVVLFVGYALYKFLIKGQRTRHKMCSHKPKLIASFLTLFYFLYLYITKTVLDVFDCEKVGDDSDPNTYLAVAALEPCGKPGGLQMRLMPAAVTFLLLYVIGYPAMAVALVWKKRHLIMEDQLLRAKHMGFDRSSNPNAYDLRKTFNKLYYAFKPDKYYWVVFIIIRKFCIAFSALMFDNNSTFQMAAVLLVIFISYALQVRYQPYMPPSEFEDVIKDHLTRKFEGDILHERLDTTLRAIELRVRKRGVRLDWSKPRKMATGGRAKFSAMNAASAVGSFLFNWNTVDSILLFCAVLVNLAGIMFNALFAQCEAENNCQFFEDQSTGLSSLTILVIFLSLLYFLVVVVVEIHTMWQQELVRIGKLDPEEVEPLGRLCLRCVTFGMRGQRPKRSSSSSSSSTSKRSARRLDDDDEEEGITTNASAKAEMNPLFKAAMEAAAINNTGIGDGSGIGGGGGGGGGGAAGGSGGDGVDSPSAMEDSDVNAAAKAVLAITDPPSREAWEAIQRRFVSMASQIERLSAQMRESRRTEAETAARAPISSTEAAILASRARAVASTSARRGRRMFGQVSMGSSGRRIGGATGIATRGAETGGYEDEEGGDGVEMTEVRPGPARSAVSSYPPPPPPPPPADSSSPLSEDAGEDRSGSPADERPGASDGMTAAQRRAAAARARAAARRTQTHAV